MSEPEAIPAATVIVMRETADGPPELLIVERVQGDVVCGWRAGVSGRPRRCGRSCAGADLSGRSRGYRCADCRGARDGGGGPALRIGLHPVPDGATADPRSARCVATPAISFGEALLERRRRLTLDLDALVPFARWLPAHASICKVLRYALLSRPRMPDGVSEPVVDGIPRMSASSGRRHAKRCSTPPMRGRVRIIFPTRRNLERLARVRQLRRRGGGRPRAIRCAPITPWDRGAATMAGICASPTISAIPSRSEPLTTRDARLRVAIRCRA
jgi:hypothetical protein